MTNLFYMPTTFKCLSFLDSAQCCIVEIALIVSEGKHMTRLFRWLLVRKADLRVSQMWLPSDDNSRQEQERYFDIGFLNFDPDKGVFTQQDRSSYAPEQEPLEVPEDHVLAAISDFLQEYQAEVMSSE